MGVINVVKSIKEVHCEEIVLIEIGNFYYVYGKDSYIIAYLFEYQLKQIENIYSCAFPRKSINKIIAKLQNKKINYIIVNRRNNYEIIEKSDKKNVNKYNEYFNKAKKYILIKNRINYINEYLNNNINEKNIKEIINEIEKIINERRKI